jgi:hypothetical protein
MSDDEEGEDEISVSEAAGKQFAALGLFIQTFEEVVSHLRDECSRILGGFQLGLNKNNVDMETTRSFLNIRSLVFHHDSMTAKPIVDIWQALTSEYCRALVRLSQMSQTGSDVTDDLVSDIANDFRNTISIRNHLIHGTWAIGHWGHYEDDFSKINLKKLKVTKSGLKERDDLPKSFKELLKLAKQNQITSGILGRFLQIFMYEPKKIETVFVKAPDGKWIITRGEKIEQWTPLASR